MTCLWRGPVRLHPLSGPLQYEFQALSAALCLRDSNSLLWIIRDPNGTDDYVVCQEASFGEHDKPLCQARFCVFVETDNNSDPLWQINLGPGVWPVQEESECQ